MQSLVLYCSAVPICMNGQAKQQARQGGRHASLLEVVSECGSLLRSNEPHNKLIWGVLGW